MEESEILKQRVRKHWENETCGTRYGNPSDRKEFFTEVSRKRYALEPYILSFARFADAAGKNVLELGVGAGSDFENWCKYAKHATGADITEAAIQLTRERLELKSVPRTRYKLQIADAERLQFDNNSFDIVYSWGVLHHTPNTITAFKEAYRVLKPNGVLRAMVYHTWSWTNAMLYLRYGIAKGKPFAKVKDVVFDNLESPGTKVYDCNEVKEFLEQIGFSQVSTTTRLGPSDLLEIQPSSKYASPLYKFIWKVYPRSLVRLLGDRFGHYLLIEAIKPASH